MNNAPIPLDPEVCLTVMASERWRVEHLDGCSVWQGAPRNGYGVVTYAPRVQRYAHRVALTAHLGRPLPDDMVIDHLCRNRMCVDPEHMELVTNDDNIARGDWGSTKVRYGGSCPQGHDDYRTSPSGHRYCRSCHNESMRETSGLLTAAAAKLGLSRKDYVAAHGQGKHAALAILSH